LKVFSEIAQEVTPRSEKHQVAPAMNSKELESAVLVTIAVLSTAEVVEVAAAAAVTEAEVEAALVVMEVEVATETKEIVSPTCQTLLQANKP
jgi:hypothetical protein